jgi:hypothetical protein
LSTSSLLIRGEPSAVAISSGPFLQGRLDAIGDHWRSHADQPLPTQRAADQRGGKTARAYVLFTAMRDLIDPRSW